MAPVPLFGRDSARADLARLLERAEAGRGALVVVRGEPGVGKTSLVESAVGPAALWGRAAASDVAPELHVWGQVLRAAERRGLGIDASAVLVTGAGAGPLASSGQERFLRLDAVVDAVRRLAEGAPLVVVLDDLQWADGESLAVVALLGAELVDLPLLLVATLRDDASVELPRPDLALDLTGLDADAAQALLTELLGVSPPPELVPVALEHTGGNPLFLTEVVRLLGRRAGDPAAWEGVLPDGVRAILQRRLEALPAKAGAVLVAAAAVGVDPEVAVVAAVVGDPPSFEEALDAAAASGLVSVRDDHISFAHALVREAALAGAAPSEVRRLRGAAAGVLEAASGRPSEIAAHHLAAGNLADATEWSIRAGDQAVTTSSYDEAAQWYERALSGGADPSVRLRLADALARSGRSEEARAHYLAVTAAARGSDAELFARAALGVGALGGGFEIQLLDQSQVTLLAEGLERLGDEPPALAARLQARLSVALTLQEEHARRLELAERAVARARASGDDGALVHALAAWCDANAAPVHTDARRDVAAEMVAAGVRSGDPELELLARRFRIVALMERGQVVEATAEIEAFGRLADALRQPAFRWYARLEEGMLAFLHGDLDAAEALAEAALADGGLVGSRNARMLAEGGLLATVRRERGDAEGFLHHITEGNQAGAEAARGMDFLYPLFLAGYGAEVPTVQAVLDQLPRELPWADHDALYLHVWASAGDAAAFAGDEGWAVRAETMLSPFPDHFVLDGTASVCLGPVAAVLGRLAARRGDVDEARRRFDHALDLVASMGAPLLRGRIERDRAALDRPSSAAPARAPSPVLAPPSADVPRFTRVGETWWLCFDGEEARLRDSKGLRDLAVLLARPGDEVHCLDLVDASAGRSSGRRAVNNDLGPALDATARDAYEARIRELTEQIEVAETAGRLDDAARLDEERAFLLRELAGALGLSGRPRPQRSDAERARKAVTMRIRDALGRIERDLPAMANHLEHSVRTGTFCSYAPEHRLEWRF